MGQRVTEITEKNSNYKRLEVWQKAYDLALFVYDITEKFPKKESYGLTSQLRRCSVSIPSNIAEGYMRQHPKEYIRFLSIARGSIGELETQLMIAKDRQFIDEEDFIRVSPLVVSVLAMLTKLIRVLKEKHGLTLPVTQYP